MKTSKSQKKLLPEWFNLENYRELAKLRGVDFLEQISIRSEIFNYLLTSGNSFENSPLPQIENVGYLYQDWKNSVSKGLVNIDDYPNIANGSINSYIELPDEYQPTSEQEKLLNRSLEANPPKLCELDAICPIDFETLQSYDFNARKAGIYKNGRPGVRFGNIVPEDAYASVSVSNLAKIISNNVLVHIDIESYTDEEILYSLKELLPVWREQLEQSEPINITGIGPYHFERILKYQTIPMLDLLIWGAEAKIKVSDEVLNRVLYPDFTVDECTSEAVRRTRKPFVISYLDRNFLKAHELYIMVNQYEDWTISELALQNAKN